MKKMLCILVSAFLALAMSAFAADTVIEGFEAATNTANWQLVSDPPQSQNSSNSPGVDIAVDAHVTQGTGSIRISNTWTIPGAAGGTNYYGTATTFWSLRINIGTPGSIASIPNNSKVRADVYNNTANAIQIAYYVRDSGGSGQFERSSWKPLTPNAATTIEWNMPVDGCVAWQPGVADGNNVLDGSSSQLRGFFLYTETAPTDANQIIDIDNIRLVEAQSDITPPAIPTLLSVSQGSAAGKLLVKWVANTESDLKEYNIYVGGNGNFSSNRMTFPASKAKVVAAPATSTEIDVPTTGSIYIKLTATDTATPAPNESDTGIFLGADLSSDGSAASDLIVLDLDRYAPGTSPFTVNGYYHDVVYYAQMLQAKGRSFGSCRALAVENGTVTLTANNAKITYWVNAADGAVVGSTTPGDCISTTSQTKLAPYVFADGNLLVSGVGLGNDLFTNGSTVDKAFLNDYLQVGMGDAIANSTNKIVADGPFATIGTFYTGNDAFTYGGFATGTSTGISNESFLPVGSSNQAMAYDPAPTTTGGYPCIYNNNNLVILGFGLESIRTDAASAGTFADAAAARATLMSDIVDYLLYTPGPPPAAASSWEMYE